MNRIASFLKLTPRRRGGIILVLRPVEWIVGICGGDREECLAQVSIVALDGLQVDCAGNALLVGVRMDFPDHLGSRSPRDVCAVLCLLC